MIDAAGAIYVIGGTTIGPDLQDVWASTDGGAWLAEVRGWSEGTRWVLLGHSGYSTVLRLLPGTRNW